MSLLYTPLLLNLYLLSTIPPTHPTSYKYVHLQQRCCLLFFFFFLHLHRSYVAKDSFPRCTHLRQVEFLPHFSKLYRRPSFLSPRSHPTLPSQLPHLSRRSTRWSLRHLTATNAQPTGPL